MQNYQRLVESILKTGQVESQRALVKGEQVTTKVLYNTRLDYDLARGIFPLVAVKRTSFKIVKEELKWFIRGKNNVTTLQEKGIKIWDDWAGPQGDIGGSYPGCWRNFGEAIGPKSVKIGADQIDRLEKLMRLHAKTGPDDPTIRKNKRHMLLLGYDPCITDNKGPIGCHTLAQWHITSDGKLHCGMYMRSVDVFLGLPYNIACYALLTNLFAKVGNLSAGTLTIMMGNCHIYFNHEAGAWEMIGRTPTAKPVLVVDFEGQRDDWSLLEGKWDAEVSGYHPQAAIKGEIAV